MPFCRYLHAWICWYIKRFASESLKNFAFSNYFGITFWLHYSDCKSVKSKVFNMSIEQIELQAKLLDYFLGSNKSNINQYVRLGDLGYSPIRPLVKLAALGEFMSDFFHSGWFRKGFTWSSLLTAQILVLRDKKSNVCGGSRMNSLTTTLN